MSQWSRLLTPKGIVVLVLVLLFVVAGGIYVAYRWHNHMLWVDKQQAFKEFKEGVEFLRAGQPDNGLAKFRDAIRLYPDLAEARNNIGVVLEQRKDFDGAVKEFSEAIRIKPDLPDAHSNLGAVFLLRSDLDGALREYREGVRLLPESAKAHNSLGVALVLHKDLTPAIEQFGEAVRLQPDFVVAHYSLARVLAIAGKPAAEVAPSLRRAVELEPRLVPVAQKDHAFDSVRNAPDVAAILGKAPYETGTPVAKPTPTPTPKPKPKPK